MLQYLELPAWTLQFVKQPWSLLTYMFMHAGILHWLFNIDVYKRQGLSLPVGSPGKFLV